MTAGLFTERIVQGGYHGSLRRRQQRSQVIEDGIEQGMWIPCRSEEHTSELQSLRHLVCRLLLEKKNMQHINNRVGFFRQRRLKTQRFERTDREINPHQHSRHSCFFFNDTATPEIYPLSLHDALPI